MEHAKKKAIIFDLDNTIYPVSSISEQLFAELFSIIEADGRFAGDFSAVKEAMQKKPFQAVVQEFHFDEGLTAQALELLFDLSFDGTIKPYDDYSEYRLKKHDGRLKFLVTIGFSKLQWSKIKQMQLESDFEGCFVVDPARSDRTKKDVFSEIMEKYKLQPKEVLVIGDDIHSEIKAGRELGMDTLLYDHGGKNADSSRYNGHTITNFKELENFI
jgi:putative hydrolase of the HAD superfamily